MKVPMMSLATQAIDLPGPLFSDDPESHHRRQADRRCYPTLQAGPDTDKGSITCSRPCVQ